MRSYRATHNLVAVSANTAEPAINIEQTLDTSLLCGMSDIFNLEHRRETNENEATGKEEPDTIYDLGATATGKLSFEKAQPQHFAFCLAYLLGECSSVALGDGYQHTITPAPDDLDPSRSLPSFTLGQRLGKTVLKRRYASMFIDSVTASFETDAWVKLEAEVKGTGKIESNITNEVISADPGASSLTLASAAIYGATDEERLASVQRVRCELVPGVWTEVDYTAVSAATPAVITIAAPGSTGAAINYEVLYAPAASGWMQFPARVTESPLRVAQMSLTVGGAWNGSTFAGGRELTSEIKSIEWSPANNMEITFVPGAPDAYASRALRNGRTQTVKLNREFRENIMQQYIKTNELFGLRILCAGALYDAVNRYQVEIIFPKVGVISSPVSEDSKMLAEEGDLKVLEHDTYGSVIVRINNQVAGYAA